jgi:hypothetical protein
LSLFLFILPLLFASQPGPPPDLSAEVRVYEATTSHNSFPDACDQRLQRLYIAEDLDLAIEVQFSRALTDEESLQVRWEVDAGDAQPFSGDFAGQANPALISTPVSGAARDAQVRVTYQGADLAPPAPLRVVTNTEYDAAVAGLAAFTDRGRRSSTRLPLTVDLLARFLGQNSTDAGTPVVETSQLNICDPRLTHRAGANWGSDTVTNVPLVHYASDQPAADIVARGVAFAMLGDHAVEIRDYFASNPGSAAHRFEFEQDGNLTLNVPVDALLALHGVQFAGTWAATVEAPRVPRAPLRASDVHVSGTVTDLYDFNLEDTGAGAAPAAEAAKLEIASVKHDIVGKVFLVSVDLDQTLPALDDDPARPTT